MITYEEAWSIATYWSAVRYHVKDLERKVGWGPWIESLGYTLYGKADKEFTALREYIHSNEDNGNLIALSDGVIRDICDVTGLDPEDYIS